MKEAASWIDRYRTFWEESLDRLDDYLKALQSEPDANLGGQATMKRVTALPMLLAGVVAADAAPPAEDVVADLVVGWANPIRMASDDTVTAIAMMVIRETLDCLGFWHTMARL